MANQYDCPAECQGVHQHCKGCGVLSGPTHLYELRDGFCFRVFVQEPYETIDGETGVHDVWKPAWRNCAEANPVQANIGNGVCVDCQAATRGRERCARCHHKHQMTSDPDYAANVRSLEAARARRRRAG